MIKVNELRIGNRLNESNSFSPREKDLVEMIVGSINDIDKVVRDNEGNGYSYDSLYPIPLTPEWLEGMGFKRGQTIVSEQYYSISRNKLHVIELVYKEGVYQLTINEGEYELGNPLHYVHQIQNLYFALTGEELHISAQTS